MRALRVSLLFVNLAILMLLLAIPFAILFNVTANTFTSPLIFGWLIFFVPFVYSFIALLGVCFSRLWLTKKTVLVASTGSFLMGFLPIFMLWKGPAQNYIIIGLFASMICFLNFLSLWEPLKEHLRKDSG